MRDVADVIIRRDLTGHSLRGVVQRPHVWMLIELIVIAIWATIVGSAMLDFNEDVVPAAFD
ncbi:MAG: hypothetical protein AB7G88_13005, partial [Thermomicrobiales bacterium]